MAEREWQGVEPAKLEAFIRNTGLSYKTTRKSYIFTCPHCRKRDKLYIRRYDGRFVCWVCAETKGFRGAPEFALVELTGLPFKAVKEALYGNRTVEAAGFLDIRMGDFLESGEVEESDFFELPVRDEPYHHLVLTDPQAAPGVSYLAGRGIDLDLAMGYHIKYSPENRAVVFPVEVGDALVGWQYRTIDPVKVIHDGQVFNRLKVWSSYEIPREHVVMFGNRIAGEHAVLCEGPVDALKAHLVGGNVATMGKAINQAQVELLLRAGVRRLYVALDPDAAGEVESLASRFHGIEAFEVKIPPPYEDLGAMPLAAARDTILGARPLLEKRMRPYFRGCVNV